jgi:hypothetical protein
MMKFYDRFDNVKLRDLIANSKLFASRESSKKNILQFSTHKREKSFMVLEIHTNKTCRKLTRVPIVNDKREIMQNLFYLKLKIRTFFDAGSGTKSVLNCVNQFKAI